MLILTHPQDHLCTSLHLKSKDTSCDNGTIPFGHRLLSGKIASILSFQISNDHWKNIAIHRKIFLTSCFMFTSLPWPENQYPETYIFIQREEPCTFSFIHANNAVHSPLPHACLHTHSPLLPYTSVCTLWQRGTGVWGILPTEIINWGRMGVPKTADQAVFQSGFMLDNIKGCHLAL